MAEISGDIELKSPLYHCVKFFRLYPEIVVSVTPQSLDTRSADISKIPLLAWTHYSKLMQVVDSDTRTKRKLIKLPDESVPPQHMKYIPVWA